MKRDAVTGKSRLSVKIKKPVNRVLGPIPDLERHVRPDWWRNIFNSLYLKTDADVVDDLKITRDEVDLIGEILKPHTESRILDLACGQGRHSLELARRGFNNIEGLDRSHYLIAKAKTRAKREGLNVKFREGDARKIPFANDTFDFIIIMGNSFGYFENANEDKFVLEQVFKALKPRGRVLIDVADGDFLRENFQPRSWEWINKKYFVCRERSLSSDEQRLISREVITHVEKGVIADQFYAERLYSEEKIKQLFDSIGFKDIEFHGQVTPDSRRNQDLGMMQQRLIVSGTVKKEWSAVPRKPRVAVKSVVVVMGDPRKPDPIKPTLNFDDDDFYTIDQLKGALKEQEDYRFEYLDNHDTLITDLMKLKGKTDYVFNLCDEGFSNDARKELHVPAILDMLEIPFTGSGAQCLAFCYDKSLVRGIAKEMAITVPEAFFVNPEDKTFDLPFGFPALVKPNFGDSSFGITQGSVAYTLEELVNAISNIRTQFGYDKPVLVEEFLTGKDLSLGIIGNPPESYMVLPLIEEDYSALPEDLPKICGYEAKWLPDSPYWQIKSIAAIVSDDIEKTIIESSLRLSERLECRDYARFDWRLDQQGVPKLLEVNPNPGWCWDGHLAKMARIAGQSYGNMLLSILQAAERRINPREDNFNTD